MAGIDHELGAALGAQLLRRTKMQQQLAARHALDLCARVASLAQHSANVRPAQAAAGIA